MSFATQFLNVSMKITFSVILYRLFMNIKRILFFTKMRTKSVKRTRIPFLFYLSLKLGQSRCIQKTIKIKSAQSFVLSVFAFIINFFFTSVELRDVLNLKIYEIFVVFVSRACKRSHTNSVIRKWQQRP